MGYNNAARNSGVWLGKFCHCTYWIESDKCSCLVCLHCCLLNYSSAIKDGGNQHVTEPFLRLDSPLSDLWSKYQKALESEVAQSCPTLCNPMDCSLPGSSVDVIFQAGVPEWVAISFSRGSSDSCNPGFRYPWVWSRIYVL